MRQIYNVKERLTAAREILTQKVDLAIKYYYKSKFLISCYRQRTQNYIPILTV